MHFQLRVASDAHLGHELSLCLHCLLQLKLNFVHLASVINYVSHHFVLSLK